MAMDRLVSFTTLKNHILSYGYGRWNIGFIENVLQSVLSGDEIHFHWMRHHIRGSWFADPFVLEVTDNEIILLAEEFVIKEWKGRISKLFVDKNTYQLNRHEVVLDLPYHLSFPIIRRDDNNVYIYPESLASGTLNEYKLSLHGADINHSRVICRASIVDAVIAQFQGISFIFATSLPSLNGNKLDIFKIGDGQINKLQTVTFEENIARNAGDLFTFQGKTYRPAQECNQQYGQAVVIQEMNMGKNGFTFKDVRRIYTSHPILNRGTHTFNIYKDVIVTDTWGDNHEWILWIFQKGQLIKQLLRKVKTKWYQS